MPALASSIRGPTLCHVDVVPRRPPAPVLPLLGVDGDGQGGADGLAQLAGNAALLARRVAAQGVLAAEPGRDGALLKRVHDGVGRAEELLQHDVHAADHLAHEEEAPCPVQRALLGLHASHAHPKAPRLP